MKPAGLLVVFFLKFVKGGIGDVTVFYYKEYDLGGK